MKVKTELVQACMQKYEVSAAILAREMGVTVGEVEKRLCGTAVNEETARRFIYYFGADNAVYYPINHLQIELYTSLKDPETEDKVEKALSSLFWEKSEYYIDSEQCYQIIYEIEV